MKTVKVKVYYNNAEKTINVKFDEEELILLSESKKSLNAQEIFNMFKYENDKTYELENLDDLTSLDEDSQFYINECYKIFKKIIDGISTPED